MTDDLAIKVTNACHRIEDLYNESNGKCYVSFSGGKDSTVLLALIKMCIEVYTLPQEGIKAVYSETGLELGATSKFVRWCKDNWYPNIEIIRPKSSFDSIIKEYGKPVKSKNKSQYLMRWQKGNRSDNTVRNLLGVDGVVIKTRISDKDMHLLSDSFDIKISDKCCYKLKKEPMKHYEKENGIKGKIIGIRMYEGGSREISIKSRVARGGKLCTVFGGGITSKYPIIDWTDEDIENFIKEYDVPLSEAYTVQGYERTGCFLCPYSLRIESNLKRLYEYEPNRYKAAMHWLKDVYIAQNVKLPFDQSYEREREREWHNKYAPMRNEMLKKYRPNSRLISDGVQLSIFDYLEENEDEKI